MKKESSRKHVQERSKVESSFLRTIPDDMRSKHRRRKTRDNRMKTILYVDHGNLVHGFENVLGDHAEKSIKTTDVETAFEIVREKARRVNELVQSNVFLGFPPITIDLPVELSKHVLKRKKRLETAGFFAHLTYNQSLYRGGMKEESVDIDMAVQIVIDALEDRFEKAIIVSGDADFAPVIGKLKCLEKEFEIWSFKDSLSPELVKASGDFSKIKALDSILSYKK